MIIITIRKIHKNKLDLYSENTWLSYTSTKNPKFFSLSLLFKHVLEISYIKTPRNYKNKTNPKTRINNPFERQMINRKGYREAGCYRGGKGK